MDILQTALVLLILVVAISLGVLGFQVFLILKDLRKSLDKIDQILGSGERVVRNVEKPVAAVASAVESVSRVVKSSPKPVTKPAKRFFKRL